MKTLIFDSYSILYNKEDYFFLEDSEMCQEGFVPLNCL